MRRGEVCGLRWEDVDLSARTVTIGRSRVVVGSQVIVKAPKSANGARTLPLDDVLAAALQALHDRQVTEHMEAGPAYVASGYVVADQLGAAVNPGSRRRSAGWLPALARRSSGCMTAAILSDSLMAAAGVPPHIRAAWCGHTEAVNERTSRMRGLRTWPSRAPCSARSTMPCEKL